MMVVFEVSELMLVERVVGETREAGTEAKDWLPAEDCTVTSKCPGTAHTT